MQHSVQTRPTTSKNLLQNPAFMALKQAKVTQYQRVIDTAQQLLASGSPAAALVIYCEFDKYKVLAKKEERFLVRKGQMSILQHLFTHKTIVDIWWSLPTHIRDLWDAAPELKAWKEQYR
mgnify:CR=1 FL=1